MKFLCTRENMAKALTMVIGVAGKNVSLPILGNVLIKATEQKVDFSTTQKTKLFLQILLIASSTAVISTIIAFFISSLSGYKSTSIIITKILLISLINVVLLVTVIFIVAIIAGLHFYKKKEDPNNFLIPITTSVADFGNMIILSLLVVLFF